MKLKIVAFSPCPSLSVIIPAYKEENVIERTLQANLAFARANRHLFPAIETIVYDDGQVDRTEDIIRGTFPQEFGTEIRYAGHNINIGKAGGVTKGMLELAQYPSRMFMDADGSTQLDMMLRFVPYIRQRYDVIIGSRAILRGAELPVKQPFKRQFGGWGLRSVTNVTLLPGIFDTQCGFKWFTEEAAREIFSRLTLTRFSFDIQALFLARIFGFHIKEVGVVWRDDPDSKVESPIREGLKMIRGIGQIWGEYYRGRYGVKPRLIPVHPKRHPLDR